MVKPKTTIGAKVCTLEVLVRFFKTFKIASHIRPSTLPKDLDTSEDLNSIEQTSFLSTNIIAEWVTINKIQESHDTCLKVPGQVLGRTESPQRRR